MAHGQRLGRLGPGETGAARAIVPITPSDSADLPGGITRGILVGDAGGGAATLIDAAGEVRTNVPLQQGYNPIAVKRVYATGIGVTDIWALY